MTLEVTGINEQGLKTRGLMKFGKKIRLFSQRLSEIDLELFKKTKKQIWSMRESLLEKVSVWPIITNIHFLMIICLEIIALLISTFGYTHQIIVITFCYSQAQQIQHEMQQRIGNIIER